MDPTNSTVRAWQTSAMLVMGFSRTPSAVQAPWWIILQQQISRLHSLVAPSGDVSLTTTQEWLAQIKRHCSVNISEEVLQSLDALLLAGVLFAAQNPGGSPAPVAPSPPPPVSRSRSVDPFIAFGILSG